MSESKSARQPQNLPAKPQPRQPPAVVPASPPRYLAGWQMSHRITGWTPEMVRADLAKWEPTIIPANEKQIAVLLEQTLALYGAPDNWNEVAEFYLEVLEDVPLDLIRKALKHVRLTLKWFPKPVELREPIVEELSKRKAAVSRLRMMLEHGDFEELATPKADRKITAETQKILDDVRRQTALPGTPNRKAS